MKIMKVLFVTVAAVLFVASSAGRGRPHRINQCGGVIVNDYNCRKNRYFLDCLDRIGKRDVCVSKRTQRFTSLGFRGGLAAGATATATNSEIKRAQQIQAMHEHNGARHNIMAGDYITAGGPRRLQSKYAKTECGIATPVQCKRKWFVECLEGYGKLNVCVRTTTRRWKSSGFRGGLAAGAIAPTNVEAQRAQQIQAMHEHNGARHNQIAGDYVVYGNGPRRLHSLGKQRALEKRAEMRKRKECARKGESYLGGRCSSERFASQKKAVMGQKKDTLARRKTLVGTTCRGLKGVAQWNCRCAETWDKAYPACKQLKVMRKDLWDIIFPTKSGQSVPVSQQTNEEDSEDGRKTVDTQAASAQKTAIGSNAFLLVFISLAVVFAIAVGVWVGRRTSEMKIPQELEAEPISVETV